MTHLQNGCTHVTAWRALRHSTHKDPCLIPSPESCCKCYTTLEQCVGCRRHHQLGPSDRLHNPGNMRTTMHLSQCRRWVCIGGRAAHMVASYEIWLAPTHMYHGTAKPERGKLIDRHHWQFICTTPSTTLFNLSRGPGGVVGMKNTIWQSF